MTTTATLTALTETQPSTTLLAAAMALDEKGTQTQAERMTFSTIADVLMKRHDLEFTLDAIYFADDFEGSFLDALVMAMAVQGVEL